MGGIIERMTDILVANRCCDRYRGEKIARALLRAAFDPTDEMVEAGWQHTGDPCWKENAVDTWRAMIEVALKEGVEA